MNETDQQKLRLKQAELFVANQILSAQQTTSDERVTIDPLPLNDLAAGKTIDHDYVYQTTGIESLAKKNLIQKISGGTLRISGIILLIKNLNALKSLRDELFESIPSTGNSIRIVYSTKSGIGKINGERFKLNRKSRNRKVFEYLVKHPNQYHSKKQIWKVAGEKGTYTEDSDRVNEFNTVITTLREALKGIGSEHLRLKKMVILDAEVTLTD